MSASNDWYTPEYIIKAVKDMWGEIDLDPASCDVANETVKAEKIFTKDQDGLSQQWRGRVFCNPPYSDKGSPIKKWIGKAEMTARAPINTEVVMLLNANTSSGWFHNLWDHHICFLYDRVKFKLKGTDKKSAPTTGQVVVYMGEEPEQFKNAFQDLGAMYRPWRGR